MSSLLYKFSSRYIDKYNSDNNSDSSTNGEENFLRRFLPNLKSGVVIDVGANIGCWSKYCLSIRQDLSMHLFEPSKFTFNRLNENEWPNNVALNHCGLGEKEGILTLNVVGEGAGMNSIYQRHGIKSIEISSTEEIQIMPLDMYCANNDIESVDLLKVDVEGHELSVFEGAREMLSRKRINFIQFEYGGCNLDARVHLLDIWKLLQSYGYTIGKLYPDYILWFDDYEQSLETFKYSNYIAKR